MFALLSAAQIQGFPINTPTMQKQWPAGYPNMIKSYKDASAEAYLRDSMWPQNDKPQPGQE